MTMRKRQIAPCFDEDGFERDSPLDMRKRLTDSSYRRQCDAEIVVCFGGIGKEIGGQSEQRHGLGEVAGFHERRAPLVPDLSQVRARVRRG